MDLTYSDEQIMLRDSVEGFLRKTYTLSQRHEALSSDLGYDRDVWAQFADLGWLALPLPESHGGVGGGAIETAILMEGFGRALVVEPWAAAIALAADAIIRFGSEVSKTALLPDIASGQSYPAFAHIEREAGYNLAHVATTARPCGSGHVLNGKKCHVLGATGAGYFLVSARTGGAIASETGICIFIVPRDSKGLTVEPYQLVDGTRAARLTLEGVAVSEDALLADEISFDALEALFDAVIAATMADSVGAMDAMLQATIEYLKQRTQFGKPLSQFQALKHRLAEMKIKCEEARAASLLATLSLDKPRAFRVRCVSGAKAKIGRVSSQVAQEAMQLHGAMGVSEETPIGQWFKRLYVFETSFGSTSYHLNRYREAILTGDMVRGGLLDSTSIQPGQQA